MVGGKGLWRALSVALSAGAGCGEGGTEGIGDGGDGCGEGGGAEGVGGSGGGWGSGWGATWTPDAIDPRRNVLLELPRPGRHGLQRTERALRLRGGDQAGEQRESIAIGHDCLRVGLGAEHINVVYEGGRRGSHGLRMPLRRPYAR